MSKEYAATKQKIDTAFVKLYRILTERLGMRRKLALTVEWEWSQGRLSTMEDIGHFCGRFLKEDLLEKFPSSQRGVLPLAFQEIEKDVLKTLRVLRYGGRKAQDLSIARLEFLRRQFS